MVEQLPKDPVTLEKLRFAISRVESYREMPISESLKCSVGWAAAERDAWRTAFEWREGWRSRSHDITPQSIRWSIHCDEGDEGMRLIREKLQS